MKTQFHELKPVYYLVYFYNVSNRMLVYQDYLYVEFFPRFETDLKQLAQVCRVASRTMSIFLNCSICFRIERKVVSNVALSDIGHLFECPESILRKYKITPIR